MAGMFDNRASVFNSNDSADELSRQLKLGQQVLIDNNLLFQHDNTVFQADLDYMQQRIYAGLGILPSKDTWDYKSSSLTQAQVHLDMVEEAMRKRVAVIRTQVMNDLYNYALKKSQEDILDEAIDAATSIIRAFDTFANEMGVDKIEKKTSLLD